MVRYGVAKWRRVDWRGEPGVVDLSSRQLCDPHLHHAWIWRMGPWRLASGTRQPSSAPAVCMRILVTWLYLLCRVLPSICIELTKKRRRRTCHFRKRCPSIVPVALDMNIRGAQPLCRIEDYATSTTTTWRLSSLANLGYPQLSR